MIHVLAKEKTWCGSWPPRPEPEGLNLLWVRHCKKRDHLRALHIIAIHPRVLTTNTVCMYIPLSYS